MENAMLRHIDQYLLRRMQEELGGMFVVQARFSSSCILEARSGFALGMMVGHVMNRFVRDGQGFDRMTINVRDFTMTVTLPKTPGQGRLLIEWK